MPPLYLVAALVVIALAYAFLNGMNGSANTIATLVASRALPPQQAMPVIALCTLAGPFLFGVSVATTIGNEIVSPQAVTIAVMLAALIAATIWSNITLRLGIPSSTSHAFVGGLLGAIVGGFGFQVIHPTGLLKVILALFLSPLLGLILSVVTIRVLLSLLRSATPKANVYLRRAQWFTTAVLALSQSTNDSQKTMGVITLGLVSAGLLPSFQVPLWVVASSAVAIALVHPGVNTPMVKRQEPCPSRST